MLSNRQHTVIACVMALTCLYALHLSSVEVQPWDEGLYAVRAQSIVVYGAWADQTPHALGGLYSSTPPPLVPWLMAVCITVFGPGVASLRLLSVLCSGVALLALYSIARRVASERSSILAMCVLAGSMHWALYARQGMTEVPLMCFCLLSLAAAFRVSEGRPGKSGLQDWSMAIVAGIAFGAALLTKMTISFIPLLAFAGIWIMRPQHRMRMVAAGLLGLAIAAPWYGMMIGRYGSQFLAALLTPHLTTTVEGNSRSLGLLYVANQLIVAHPLMLAALITVGAAIVRPSTRPTAKQLPIMICMIWFAVGFLAFTIAPTKNPHYIVTLLPAGTLIAVYGLERLMEQGSRRLVVIVYSIATVAAVWSVLSGLRSSLRTGHIDAPMIPVLAVLAGVAVAPFVLRSSVIDVLSVRAYRPVVYGVSALMLLHTLMMIAVDPPPMVEGGKEVATELLDSHAQRFGYLYHRHNDADSLNPQLAWYTAGWMAEWLPDRSYRPFALPPHQVDANIVAIVGALGLPYIVYYHGMHAEAERLRVDEVLRSTYRTVPLASTQYTLYQRR